MAQLQNPGGLVHPGLDLVDRHLLDLQAVGHVVEHAHVWVQRVVLEHHGNVALGRLEVVDHPPANGNFAARDFFQAGHHAQQRGLATPRRADDDDEFTVGNVGVHPVDDLQFLLAFAVLLDDVFELSAMMEAIIFPYQPGP
jgi:hypothetical protein